MKLILLDLLIPLVLWHGHVYMLCVYIHSTCLCVYICICYPTPKNTLGAICPKARWRAAFACYFGQEQVAQMRMDGQTDCPRGSVFLEFADEDNWLSVSLLNLGKRPIQHTGK